MARIQFGSLVTGISGKVGGHIFGNSVNGPTIRNNTQRKKLWAYGKRTGSFSSLQPQVNVSLISQSWKDLTDAERAAWVSYAVQYYTTLNLYGSHTLTGYACYSKINHNILLCGLPLITIPVPKQSMTDPGTCSVVTLSPTVFTVAFTNALSHGEYFLVSCTGTNSVTLTPQKKGFKIIQVFDFHATSPLDIASNYIAIKGAPLTGGWVTVKIEIINVLTGQRGMARSFTHVVA